MIEAIGWMALGIVALFVVVGLIVILSWIPEVRRYAKVRQM